MLSRIAAFALCVTLLVGCGTATPATPVAEAPTAVALPPTAVEVQVVATNAPSATVMPTTAPEATSVPTEAPTAEATVSTIKAAEMTTPVQKGYLTLVLLKGSAAMLDSTATQIQAGKLQGFDGFGRLLAIGAFLKAIDENLAKDAPDPALTDAWEQGRAVVPQLKDILSKWLDKKITSKEVPDLVAAAQPALDQMLDTAESDLGSAYNADPAKLKEIRDKALTDLQNTLEATPTPKK